MRFQNSIGMNTSGPDLRATGPIPKSDLEQIATLSGGAMTAAERRLENDQSELEVFIEHSPTLATITMTLLLAR